ncbi:putative FAD dependent oxidoreductase [Sporormia fimetaria CBS 119925]|uniref:L-2-hydroxyglutarate dehydrogenase, mitochondrial n=1 Tax=Sporormia fimetaria CBS 119925 TaxID=1340428 RepID=A0A6A6V3Y4_9PLEO|nr:putative FAD dependent oxidoreductase [Sporormia fimetaria CBS 119925]
MFSRAVARTSHLQQYSRSSSWTAFRNADCTHAVIGGGVVGLAIARQLQAREGVSTILIEKHGSVGTETSSRNSEVIHAGLYYGADTLKTSLCIRGKELLYSTCAKYNIPHSNCGKWIVAQDSEQLSAIQKVHDFSKQIGVPTHFVSKTEAQQREPDVRAEAGVLESPTTGIVDSHALMQFLEADFLDKGGLIAFHSPVTDISPIRNGAGGWNITTTTSPPRRSSSPAPSDTITTTTTITSETLINSAGLSAIPLSNSILPQSRHRNPYYAKGTYYSYSLSTPRPKTLIYPAPVPGHAGLGTHLTLDMGGRIRFGPDVEWTDSSSDYLPNAKNLEAALDDIQTYLPGIKREAVGADYVGIRPKLGRGSAVVGGSGFNDFWIEKEEGYEGWVNLLGIESPGLTSSLAIAERVEGLLYK